MWIFLLEADVALGLRVFVVRWAWPRPEKENDGGTK